MSLSLFLVCSFRSFFRHFQCFSPSDWEFLFEGYGLGVVVGDLFPVLSQSINWFRGLIKERKRMSEMRSSELEIGLSSSDGPMEEDTTVSSP